MQHKLVNILKNNCRLSKNGILKFIFWEKITIATNQRPRSSQGLNFQPKSTHVGTYGSSNLCIRRWPYLAIMGGETFSPMEACCPTVGDARGVRRKLLVGG